MGRHALRTCRDCGLEAHTKLQLGDFERRPSYPHGRANKCKACVNKRMREWHAKNPSKSKEYNIKHQSFTRYGVSGEEYKACMATSDVCECCGKDTDLCYDHCHDSMKFRGVLCGSCNKAIGSLGDTLGGVQRAINYLRKHYD